MIKNSKNPKLELVYTDKKNNKWYGLKNPIADLPPARGIAGSRAERYIGLMISEKEFALALDAHSEAAKQGDIVKCFGIINDLSYRRKFLTEEKSILDLAGIYFLLEDEPFEDFSEHHAELKQAIWQEDDACRGFFLRMGLNLTKHFQNTSEEDLLKFLEETRILANRIYRHIKTPLQRLNSKTTT